MRIGIVGSEASKFTKDTEELARQAIRYHISHYDVVISGKCHLGGIDIWAIEEAKKMGIETIEYPPKIKQWEGGYKQRNLQITENSDIVICITVKELPSSYRGMKFGRCYHCNSESHVKSGGCWTVKQAKKLGKDGFVIVIGDGTWH